MFSIIAPLIAELRRRIKMFLISNMEPDNVPFTYMWEKSKLEELRGHKVVPVISHIGFTFSF